MLQPVAGGRHLGPYRHLAAGRTGRPRADRSRPLVYRWLRHPGQQGGGGGEKNASSPQQLGGPKTAQMQEPSDHALGRSRGGFGTKIHLVCDSHGFIVAIHLTAGQTHESKVFEPTMARRLFLRRRGQSRWPRRVAADKGYSYPHPAVVSAAADRSRHSHASQPATEQALQQGHLSAATHRRAGRGVLVQREWDKPPRSLS